MHKRVVWVFCLMGLFLLSAAAPAWAQGDQGKSPVFIYVAQWAVPRAQWAEMTKLDDSNKAQMEKLLADGTILSYGNFNVLVHQEGAPTHGSWFSASSMGGLMKALEAIYAGGNVTTPVQAASKHWDYILTSRDYNGHSGTFKGTYLSGASWRVKPGHEQEFWKMARAYVVPMYEKLLAEGAIHWYSVDTEAIHTDNPNNVEFVTIAADTAGLDKVRAALNEMLQKNPTLGAAFETTVKDELHRDFLGWVREMKHK